MKKTTLVTLLLSSILFSSPSYGEWTRVSTNVSGHNYYVDFDRIRKHDGYVYYWTLSDYLKPTKYGDLSAKLYRQGDCKLFRVKRLSSSYYTVSMGNGTPSASGSIEGEWDYPTPKSSLERILNSVCSH